MLQKNVVKNNSMRDMLRYVYTVKLQNFLNAPRMLCISGSVYDIDILFANNEPCDASRT